MTITFDAEPLKKWVEGFAERVEELKKDFPEVLPTWQADDMHRKRPETAVQGVAAKTIVRPRGRVFTESGYYVPGRSGPTYTIIRRHGRAWTRVRNARPILREVLVDELIDRVVKAAIKTATGRDAV